MWHARKRPVVGAHIMTAVEKTDFWCDVEWSATESVGLVFHILGYGNSNSKHMRGTRADGKGNGISVQCM
jgi:hypothetical protein